MADKGSQYELTLRRMEDGGYVVIRPKGYTTPEVYAASTIDEALAYMRGQILPVVQTGKGEWHLSEDGKQWARDFNAHAQALSDQVCPICHERRCSHGGRLVTPKEVG